VSKNRLARRFMREMGGKSADIIVECVDPKVSKILSEAEVKQITEAYFRELQLSDIECSAITLDDSEYEFSDSEESPESESASEYLDRMRDEFSKIPADVDPEAAVRYEVEEQQIILVLLPRGVRAFAGFKQERPLFCWDFRFAANLDEEAASAIQKQLQALGFETRQRPVLVRAEETF
jgi:hypothetical protein